MIVEDFAARYRYPPAEVIRVIDGDTIEVELPLPLDIRYRALLRLIGYDAPEMNLPEGLTARMALASIVESVPVYVETFKERRSFTRYTARVWVHPESGDPNLILVSDLMLASGLVVPWP
jgi:endonuclease YncB( thermonuclease family)